MNDIKEIGHIRKGRKSIAYVVIFNFLIGNADAHAKNISSSVQTRENISCPVLRPHVNACVSRTFTEDVHEDRARKTATD